MDSKRKNMQHGVSSASDQLSTRLNLVTTLTHGFRPSYKSCCSTKHAPPHLDIIFTQNKNPMISNLMKQLIAWFWHVQTYKTNKPLGFGFLFGTYGLTHEQRDMASSRSASESQQPSVLPHTSKAVKIRNNSLSLSIFTIIS